jgi:AraC-like DNA-binding protein
MASPELARANDQVVIDYLKRNDKGNIINDVRGCIIECLPSGGASQEKVASQVNRSTRSLQRKLSEHGTSYKKLYEEIRKDLAMQYLKESNHTISEVTYLLGFTEPSNFTRSFKRWTGITPNEYQES